MPDDDDDTTPDLRDSLYYTETEFVETRCIGTKYLCRKTTYIAKKTIYLKYKIPNVAQ